MGDCGVSRSGRRSASGGAALPVQISVRYALPGMRHDQRGDFRVALGIRGCLSPSCHVLVDAFGCACADPAGSHDSPALGDWLLDSDGGWLFGQLDLASGLMSRWGLGLQITANDVNFNRRIPLGGVLTS